MRPVVLAAVAGAHGLKGEVRLKLFTGDLLPYKRVTVGDRALTLAALRGEVARFAEVTDRTAAEGLRGQLLTVPRSALPPLADGEYYHSDLLDLPAVDPSGVDLGRVVAVDNYGAGDVLEIERPDGRRFMIPMRVDAVPEWDAHRLVVDPAFST
jgi:16S rRNA processing protein RimM